MQDVQNIPPPDANSTERDNDFGNHSDIPVDLDNEIEKPDESVPLPPDQQPFAPVREPTGEDKYPVGENNEKPKQII